MLKEEEGASVGNEDDGPARRFLAFPVAAEVLEGLSAFCW